MFGGSLSANIHLVVIAAFSFFVILGALMGVCRGFSKQLIRTVTVIASVVLALWCANIGWGYFNGFFEGKTVEEICTIVSGYVSLDLSWLLNFDVATVRAIIAIPLALIIVPIVFSLAFFIIHMLMLIVNLILCGILGFNRKRKNALSRLLGLALGALQGAAVAGLLLMPFISAADAIDVSVSAVAEADPENQSIKQLSEKYNYAVRDTLDGPIAKTLNKVGLSKLYKGITTVKLGEDKICMVDTLDDTVDIIGSAMSLKGAEWKSLTEENKTSVVAMVDTLVESKHFSSICAGIVSGVAKTVENGQLMVNAGPPVDSIIAAFLEIFETENADTIGGDLHTIVDIYFILSDSGALAAFDGDSNDMLKALTAKDESGKTNVSKVIEVLKGNERTKPLVTLMTRLSVSVMSETLNLGEGSEELYENVKTGLTEATEIKKTDYETEEEYVAAVSNSIDNTLKENGIELEADIVDSMAEYVSENIEQLENIGDDELNDLILHYYEAYADKIGQ